MTIITTLTTPAEPAMCVGRVVFLGGFVVSCAFDAQFAKLLKGLKIYYEKPAGVKRT